MSCNRFQFNANAGGLWPESLIVILSRVLSLAIRRLRPHKGMAVIDTLKERSSLYLAPAFIFLVIFFECISHALRSDAKTAQQQPSNLSCARDGRTPFLTGSRACAGMNSTTPSPMRQWLSSGS